MYCEVKETSGQRRDMPESLSGSRQSSSLPQLPLTSSTNCSMDELLQLIRQFYINTEHSSEQHSAEFLSKKITNKLVTQIQDPLVLSAASLPGSIVWLQQQQDLEQRGRGSSSGLRPRDHQEFRIGRASRSSTGAVTRWMEAVCSLSAQHVSAHVSRVTGDSCSASASHKMYFVG